MRSLYLIVLGILITLNVFSKTTIDTTYSNQWNSQLNKWEYFDRVITTYANELISSEMIQTFDGNQWINYNFISYHYNNNLVVEELEQYWNESKLLWEDNYRKLFSYNAQKKLSQITHQNIYNGIYVNSSREILIYSKDGKLIEKIVQQFEEAWTNFLKYQYYYNADDLLIEENLANWNQTDWEEDNISMAYIYDKQGNIVEKLKTEKSKKNSTNLLKEEFHYSQLGIVEEHIVYTWNSRKDNWVDKSRAKLTDDMNGYIISKADRKNKKNSWTNHFFEENPVDHTMLSNKSFTDNKTFAVYPSKYGREAVIEFSNPNNELYLVRVINEDGQFIGSATTKKEEISIDARNLNKGFYFVELQGSNLYSGKFSIE